ncbi:MAG: hypothetical protein ACF8PN_05660 [Phycisphaerales bacterium]
MPDPHEPGAGFTSLRTPCAPDEVRERLIAANRRGVIPEVHWPARDRFRITINSHPLLARLIGRVRDETNGAAIDFALELNRVQYHAYVWISAISIVAGPWLTERFSPWPLYSWYWLAPLTAVSTIWIAWRWPRRSLRDARAQAKPTLRAIQARLDATTA